MTDAEKRLTSYHEAGHAITGYFCKTHDPVHQISIIPRGSAGGFTMYLPEKDPSYVTKTAMNENIVCLLGGRVAEQLGWMISPPVLPTTCSVPRIPPAPW